MQPGREAMKNIAKMKNPEKLEKRLSRKLSERVRQAQRSQRRHEKDSFETNAVFVFGYKGGR